MSWLPHLLWILFGPSTWGAGGNMAAWVICGGIGFAWLHGKQKAMHMAKMAQAERHHAEQMAQATAHLEIMKAHVSETLRLPARRSAPKGGA